MGGDKRYQPSSWKYNDLFRSGFKVYALSGIAKAKVGPAANVNSHEKKKMKPMDEKKNEASDEKKNEENSIFAKS